MTAPAVTDPKAAPATAPAAAPVPGTPEHDAAMVAKFEGKEPAPAAAAAPAKPAKPDHVPEKFWDADKGEVRLADLLKSYGELERTRAPAAATAPAAAAAAAPNADPNAAPAATTAAADKVSLKAAADEFLTNGGKLSDETVTKLEKAGHSKEDIDLYMNGVRALQDQYTSKAHTHVGGKEQYEAMIAWAGKALTPEQIDAFDAAVSSGSEAQMLLAIDGVKAKFIAANGQPPQLVGGERPAGNVTAFRDRSEMTAAMKDPRYKTSPAYRKDVEQKIAGMTNW